MPVMVHVSSLPPTLVDRFPNGWVMLTEVEVHGAWPASPANPMAAPPPAPEPVTDRPTSPQPAPPLPMAPAEPVERTPFVFPPGLLAELLPDLLPPNNESS